MSRHGPDAASAARAMIQAKRQLAAARRQLAEVTVPTPHHDVLIDPTWRVPNRALREHRDKLLALPNVVGVGLGFRRSRGVLTGERCLLIFVRRKHSKKVLDRRDARHVPAYVRAGKTRVPTDVVEFGKLERHVDAGVSLGPATLDEMGTLGTFAIDRSSGLAVALTAMHVSGEDDCPPQPEVAFVSPSRIEGSPRPFGLLVRGTMHGIDAAKIAIDPQIPVSMSIQGIGPIRGWRPLSHPGDRGTAVQMFGARSGRTVFGRIVDVAVSLPEYELDAAILVDIPSSAGDSGAAIVDNEHLVLGLLAGQSSKLEGLRVFTPIGRVLARLACDIPSTD